MMLVQHKYFPCMNGNISFSTCMRVLEPFFEKYHPECQMPQQRIGKVLLIEDARQDIVQLVGKDSLSEEQNA